MGNSRSAAGPAATSHIPGLRQGTHASPAVRSASGRFWDVTFPLLAPTGFFLLIINITHAHFDTFGIVEPAAHMHARF